MTIKKLMMTSVLGACLAVSMAAAQDAAEIDPAMTVTEQVAEAASEAVTEVTAEVEAAVTEQVSDSVPEVAASDAASETSEAVASDMTPPALEGMDAAAEAAEDMVTEAAETVTELTETVAVAPAGPEGMWTRDNGNQVKVEFRDGAMYCTIINRTKRNGKPKKDFEMCHGMTADGETWTGKKMKHPEMPGFMTFKGTVSMADDVISIKGCAVGVCDSENWTRMAAEG